MTKKRRSKSSKVAVMAKKSKKAKATSKAKTKEMVVLSIVHFRAPSKSSEHSRQPWYMLPLIVEVTGLEPASFSLQTKRSAN